MVLASAWSVDLCIAGTGFCVDREIQLALVCPKIAHQGSCNKVTASTSRQTLTTTYILSQATHRILEKGGIPYRSHPRQRTLSDEKPIVAPEKKILVNEKKSDIQSSGAVKVYSHSAYNQTLQMTKLKTSK